MEYTPEQYIKKIWEGSPYDHEGKLERMERMTENAAEMMGRMLEVLFDKKLLKDYEVEKILGDYGVQVMRGKAR